jgi:hypothetical protein
MATVARKKTAVAKASTGEQPEDEVAYLSKRHGVSAPIIKEIIRRIGSAERSAVEREIRKGMTRR